MKIDGTPSISTYKDLRKKPVAERSAEAPSAKADPAYNVELSSILKEAPVQENDEVRRAKVAEIREQLSSGTYNISGRDVAAKILNLIKK